MVPEKEQAGWERALIEGCRELGFDLTEGQVRAFAAYGRMIRQWNRPAGLVSDRDLDRLVSRHFLDSLSLARILVPLPGTRVLDVGSGAGFPGIPLKICCPGIDLTLLEPREKPWFFLRQAVTDLSLMTVSVLRKRAESLPGRGDARARFHLVLARALAPLDRLIKVCSPLVCPGGILVAYKGSRWMQELAEAGESIRETGGRVAGRPVEVPGISAGRCLVLWQRS